MTTQLRPQSLTVEDPHGKFINFTEEFRRAKRNSLAWSAITAFIAFAPNWSSEAQIFSMKLAYGQGALTLFLMVATTFFFLSFLRAKQPIISLNSAAAQESDEIWGTITATLRGWKSRLRGPETSLHHMGERVKVLEFKIGPLVEELSDFPDRFQKMFRSKLVDDERILRQILTVGVTDNVNTASELQAMGWKYLNSVGELRNKYAADLEEASARLMKLKKEAAEEDNALRSVAAALIDSIDDLERSLSTFRGAIDQQQRNWFTALDVGAVHAAFFVALLGFIMRVFVPNNLNKAISLIG